MTYGPSTGSPALSRLDFMIPLVMATVEAKAQKSARDTFLARKSKHFFKAEYMTDMDNCGPWTSSSFENILLF